MREKPYSSPAIGVYIESSFLRGAQLSLLKTKPRLDKLFEVDLSDGIQDENVKQLYILSHKNLMIYALKTEDVLVRPLDISLAKEKDIDAVLAFQVEPLLPYPIENSVIDRIVLDNSENITSLTVLATKKELILEHLEKVKELKFDPEVISCVPVALAAFSKQFSPIENTHYVMHCDNNTISCILVENGKLIAAQSAKFGDKELIDAFLKDKPSAKENEFKQLDILNINKEEFPELAKSIHQIKLEMTKLIYSIGKLLKVKNVKEILLTGNEKLMALFNQFSDTLEKSVIFPKEDPLFPISQNQLLTNAVPIGLALTGLPYVSEQVNFRQQELAYPDPWKRLKKPILIYLGLSLILAASIFLFGKAYIKNQENSVKDKYADLLLLMKKPYDQVEKDVTKGKQPDNKKLSQHSQYDLMSRLNYLQKEIEATPDIHPLLPDVPRVSDVLAWLGTLPQLEAKDEKTNTPRVQIESFNYRMVKKPEGDKKKEHYQVRIDLEFTTSVPRFAREFHDELLAPNDFVDSKEGIQWSSDQEKYRASFFLKDMTKYPN